MQSSTTANLTVRWLVGLALILLVRLLLEQQLPAGAAMGLGFAAFMFLWVPTVPQAAYRWSSPERKVLFSRLALFILAAVVSSVLYPVIVSGATWFART